MKNQFEEREFASESDSMTTFIGHNGFFCIMLNGDCIHSCKTLTWHNKKLNQLSRKFSLKEIQKWKGSKYFSKKLKK